ncbi:Fis family transcriptional regulator [Nautilia sp. PV-1]|uniref:Fis family transcriptional regulator n=1 Tax=Nautilia sp. PV-1 TaxID=2579250 RepID=UPI000FDC9CC4|nr:Fis family transcriptional regulator [Nautilia sp. PV-1]AZV45907.1 Fis family transcriptional regulator [Nautilia sp. PV-1]
MFLATSEYLKKIKNIADMCKQLKINVYIWGEKGVGKTFLAKYIAPNAVINPKTPTINPVILEDFDKNPVLEFKNNFLIATGTQPLNKEILKKYFTMDIELKPLKEHPEDIYDFIDLFKQQAKEELKISKNIHIEHPDISENLNSLKRQIFSKFLLPENKQDVYKILTDYFENINEDFTYEEELNNFEKALFKAAKTKYKSKLQIANHLKINRVTLTKKMKALNV